MCNKEWVKPVPYYIIGTHPAVKNLIGYSEVEACKKCTVREFGPKNKRRKKFFDE